MHEQGVDNQPPLHGDHLRLNEIAESITKETSYRGRPQPRSYKKRTL